MEWLFLAGLAVWILVVQGRLAAAERQLKSLQQRRVDEAMRFAVVDRETSQPAQPAPTPLAEPPPAATVVFEAAPLPAPAPPVIRETVTPPAPTAVSPPRPGPTRPALSTWLSENGLAWLGGGALVLGGALLVAYAAQRGFFTPAMRIFAALILGVAMLVAGEAIRRQTRAPGGRHALAAAITSGAGASTLYAAIWAAYALYRFLPVYGAAPLLAAISLGLLALAILHGEALAFPAIAGAFAAPILCHPRDWSGVALDGYLVVITATGLAAMSRRGWSGAGLLTLACAALWMLARQAAGDNQGAAGLLVATLAMSLLAANLRDRARATERAPTAVLMARIPAIACAGASVLWVLFAALDTRDSPLALALAGSALSLLCLAAVRTQLAPARIIAAPAIALAVIAAMRLEIAAGTPGGPAALWLLAPILALAGSALALILADNSRADPGVIGAVAGALALTCLRGPIAAAAPGEGALVFVGMATLFAVGAGLIGRRSAHPASDLAVAAWIGAAAEAVGLAIHTALAGRPEPSAYGLLAAVLALAARRAPWRGLPEAAALACLVSLLSLLGPRIAGAAFAGRLGWADLALAGGAGVLAQSMGWWSLRNRAGAATSADAASTSALISALLTLFLVLHVWATPRGALPAPLDGFTEAALRTVLLIAAGLVLTVRSGPTRFARARGPVFLGAGALHGVLLGVLILNPWWGFGMVRQIPGPPVVDALALAFLAPALLLAAAARRQAATLARAAPWTALAGLGFLVVWAVMEIRRLFHGPVLAGGGLGYGEVAAYGVALIAIAWLVTLVSDRWAGRTQSPAPARIGAAARWIALVGSAWLLCFVASPWWGPLGGAFTAPMLFFALFAATVAATALLARRGESRAAPVFDEAVKVVVTLEIFALLTLAIRSAFHGAALRTALGEASVETWTFSATWAVYGLVVLVSGARSGDRALRWLGLAVLVATTLKVFLFDMATLQGVIRAGSFLALGALLLIGAVAARRLGAKSRGAG